METLNKFINNYRQKDQASDALMSIQDEIIARNNAIINRANRSTERAQKRRRAIPTVYWTKEIMHYLGKEIVKYFPDGYTSEILGPFGITSNVSIHVSKPNWDRSEEHAYTEPNMYSFSVRPNNLGTGDNTLSIVNRSTDTGEFARGTIGQINGMNNPSIDIPNNTTIKDFILLFYTDFKFKNNGK